MTDIPYWEKYMLTRRSRQRVVKFHNESLPEVPIDIRSLKM